MVGFLLIILGISLIMGVLFSGIEMIEGSGCLESIKNGVVVFTFAFFVSSALLIGGFLVKIGLYSLT